MPAKFYNNQLEKYSKQLKRVKKSLGLISLLRLVVFVALIFGVYYFFENSQIASLIAIIGTCLFVFLVSVYTNLKYKRNKLQELVKINSNELKALKGDFSSFKTGNRFVDPSHDFSNDIDLFGEGSFFQYVNRTATKYGKEKFAKILIANNINDINKKQEAIQELRDKVEWRQNFSATASLVKTETSESTILKWLKEYTSFLPASMGKLPLIFSIASLIIIAVTGLNYLHPFFLVIWFFLGLGITGTYLKKINTLSLNTSKTQETFQQYYKLFYAIEKMTFKSELLKEQRQYIIDDTKKVSKIIQKFSKALDALDQRNNIFVAFFGNAFFLWDIMQSFRIEKWIEMHQNEVEDWFKVVAFFDAYNSLGNFAFNHPDYIFPELVDNDFIIKSENLGHPLVKKENLVANDFVINKEGVFIITGANMAGKSTFLRTVSLYIVMANNGLPICASSGSYTPVKLITSMRTSDSLSKDESYFFSELKRLKFIVDKIKEDNYFIILDEILKGTNSKDKAEGSKKFVQKISKSKSTGMIATHDLSLCEVAKKNDKVENYYFDAYIKNDELSFDYKLKKGICKNMNASFLLKRMGIV